MAGSNWVAGKHQPVCQATDEEIAQRLELVRAVKRGVNGRSLTDQELDQLLEPTPCLRTRTRLARARRPA